MMAVSWHGDAGEEFTEAAAYYEEQDAGLGERFTVHIEAGVAKLRAAPLIPRCFDGECRKVRLEKFPYAVIYRVGREAVQIIPNQALNPTTPLGGYKQILSRRSAGRSRACLCRTSAWPSGAARPVRSGGLASTHPS